MTPILVASKIVSLSLRPNSDQAIVAQHRAYEERTALARHFGGRDGERLTCNADRLATGPSAPQPSPSPLLSLQERAGNRAVVGLIQRLREGSGEARSPHTGVAPRRLIQRAPWPNVKATFQTINDEGFPNSEYSVEKTSYERYAPINEYQLPGQVYHKGERSFAYITRGDAKTNAAIYTNSAKLEGGRIILAYGDEKVEAVLQPENGLVAWDGLLIDDLTESNKWTVIDRHVGHPIRNLGESLPTLGDVAKSGEVQKEQRAVKAAQDVGTVRADLDVQKLLAGFLLKEESVAAALAALKREVGPEIGKARGRAVADPEPEAPLPSLDDPASIQALLDSLLMPQ